MKIISLLVMMSIFFTSPVIADKTDRKRNKIHKMQTKVLKRLYEEKPEAKKMIRNAEGYAVFSNVGVNLVLFSAGGGNGLVHDNNSGKNTYMNMASAGFGIGLGVKDFRAVFIFHSRKAMTRFVESGWDFSGQVDAAAKSGEKGGEGNVAATAVNGVTLYQLTENGLALQATLQGTKYWKAEKLN